MYCSHFPCYRCVTTANILLQVIVDSVAGGDDSDGFIKYITEEYSVLTEGEKSFTLHANMNMPILRLCIVISSRTRLDIVALC